MTHQWNYTADPDSVDFIETIQRDKDQALLLSDHGQIILIDAAGRKLRCWNANQRKEALAIWSKYR